MKAACGCRPGTYVNGWSEERCPECIQIEMEAWGRVIAWTRNGDIVKRLAALSDERRP